MTEKVNGELGFLLNKGTQVLYKEINRNFAVNNLDITFDQASIMFFLSHCDGKSQNEIAEKTYRDKVSVKKLIDNLEKRNLVDRKVDEDDKRIKRVYLTKNGKRLVPKLKNYAQESLEEGFEGVDLDDLAVFKKVLIEVFKNFTGKDLLKFINKNKMRWK